MGSHEDTANKPPTCEIPFKQKVWGWGTVQQVHALVEKTAGKRELTVKAVR